MSGIENIGPNCQGVCSDGVVAEGEILKSLRETRPVYRRLKRTMDVVFSALVLVCFSWLYLLITLLVEIDDPKGPVFFKQTRVGMNGFEFPQFFNVLKGEI